jgi:ELWxxDGT repeat protein
MKTSFWRHWCNSVRNAKSTGTIARAQRLRQPLGLEALEDRVTPSLTPQMVLDLNTSTVSSNPSQMVAVGATTYFTADDGVHGVELWKSNRTTAGTTLVKDIYPGSNFSSYLSSLTNVNGTLFFSATDGTTGLELWKSDGTPAGTTVVKDIVTGPNGSNPNYLTNVNGKLFFRAYDDTHGYELWKSDGTAAGTTLVKDIDPGIAASNIRWLTNFNGRLVFQANDGVHGSELWKSDGTAAGTVMVKDIDPGIGDAGPSYLTNVNGTLFFSAYDDGTTGWELWKTDGTPAGTSLVKDIFPGGPSSSNPMDLTNVNGTLFFTAYDGTHGRELWKSDGTTAGTTLVKDIVPGGTYNAYASSLTNVNGTLFFRTYDGVHGRELWKSDGTAAGTVMVKDINPSWASSDPSYLTNVNGTLFFRANDGTNGWKLWKSDGTGAGTVLVSTGASAPSNIINANGTLFFSAYDGKGAELWKSDGTAAGTTLIKDINPQITFGGSSPANLTDVNGTLFFSANDGVHGVELWKSDGTAAGTTLVKDIVPGGYFGYFGAYYPSSSSPSQLTNVNGTLFFTVWSAGTGSQLWKSDGTAAGTVPVSRVGASKLTNVNGTLFFVAGTTATGTDGEELWKSDGTTAGTTMVKDIYPGGSWRSGNYSYYYVPNSSSPAELTNVNGTLFFTATDGVNGRELWKSDGTPAGTTLVKNIRASYQSAYPSGLTNLNGTLLFSAYEDTNGRELWKSDGTAAGTVLVKDIRPGASGSYPSSLASVNGTLFFSANDGTAGYELWKSDGTAAGTTLVKDINPGSGNSYPYLGGPDLYTYSGQHPTSINGTLFFTAYNPATGRELWKSDGTAAGTTLVTDIYLGNGSSEPSGAAPLLTNVNGILFFSAYDSSNAPKLWQSDGTAVGTVLIANFQPFYLTNFNGTLFFATDDGTHGTELWKLVDSASQGTSLVASGFPATITAGVAGNFAITAQNADGSMNTSYRGTVHFTSSDPQAVLPADYTFTTADQGVHTFSATLKTAGSQSLHITDTVTSGVAAQVSTTVTPAAASRFAVAGFPSPVTAGVAGSFSVTAWDAYGNRATGYTGTIHFTSGDPRKSLPPDYTFTAADAGVHSFSATLRTAGTQSIGVTDTGNSLLAGAQTRIVVTPNVVTHFNVALFPSPQQAGVTGTFRLIARDAYNNTVTTYRGTVHFTTSDPSGAVRLPADYTFTAADQGSRSVFHATLFTAGMQSLTVTDTVTSSITGSQTGIVITPAALHHFRVYGFPNPTIAGVENTVSVQAKDLYGNTITGYTGTIAFTSSDPHAVLPSPYTFTATDAGTHTSSVTLNTAGKQSVTVKDQTAPTLTGTQANITANPAGAARFLGGSPARGGTAGNTRPAPPTVGTPLRKAMPVDPGELEYALHRHATDALFVALSLESN